MDFSKIKRLVWTVVVLAALATVYFVFFSKSGLSILPKKTVEKAPTVMAEQIQGDKPLSTEQTDAISVHKAEILARVNTGKPLTNEEKSSIGQIMFTQAHLYQFTPEEREQVFSALRK